MIVILWSVGIVVLVKFALNQLVNHNYRPIMFVWSYDCHVIRMHVYYRVMAMKQASRRVPSDEIEGGKHIFTIHSNMPLCMYASHQNNIFTIVVKLILVINAKLSERKLCNH